MSKGNKIAAAALFVLVLICASVLLLRGALTSENKVAVVYLNGEVIREIELDKIKEPIEFDIVSGEDTNHVRAELGRIRMMSANCPDKVCVNQGWIDNGALPIVCLPHKVTIEIKGGKASDVDAVTGGVRH